MKDLTDSFFLSTINLFIHPLPFPVASRMTIQFSVSFILSSSSFSHSSPFLQATLSDPGRSAMLSGGDGTSLAQLLCHAKEESRALRQEATELRCRLHDAQADTKVQSGGREGKRGKGWRLRTFLIVEEKLDVDGVGNNVWGVRNGWG